MILCSATVDSDKFKAWDSVAEWCKKEATTTVQLVLVMNKRIANVWLCPEHAEEFYRELDI